MGTRRVMVKWDNHHSTLLAGLQQLLCDEAFTDVTLVCEDHSLKTHKVFLVALSCFFQNLFTGDFQNCRIVNMMNIKYNFLKEIITLMYQGEVDIYEDQLPELFKVAELLQVKGFVENSNFNVSVNKKLVDDEKVNVEFIVETVAHQEIISLNSSDEDASPQKIDDELFIDPSSLVKQEIIEGNGPIFLDNTALHKKPEETSILNRLLATQEEYCNSIGYKELYSEIGNCSKDQDENPEIDLILYRSMHLDGRRANMISDQCQDPNNANINLKNSSRKAKGRKTRKNNFQGTANSMFTRTQNHQKEMLSEITPLQNKTSSHHQGSKEVNGTIKACISSTSAVNGENSKLPVEQNKEAITNLHFSLKDKDHLSFNKWFAKAKKYDKKSLRSSKVETSLSLFNEDFSVNDDDNNDTDPEDISYPVPTSCSNNGQKKKLKSQTIQAYDCGICHKKFPNRFNYLNHVKVHYEGTSLHSCLYPSDKLKCKRGMKSRYSEEKCGTSKQSFYQTDITECLSRKTDQKLTTLVSPFSCNSCGKVFFYKKTLMQHLETHNLYSCLQCDKRYSRLKPFIHHQKTHTNTR